jgi:hypothetical protein
MLLMPGLLFSNENAVNFQIYLFGGLLEIKVISLRIFLSYNMHLYLEA